MTSLLRFFDPAREGFARRMIRLLAALSLIPLLGLCALSMLALRSERGRYVMARSLHESDLHWASATLAGDLVEDFPDTWEYRRVQAWSLRHMGQTEESLAIYEAAIEAMPENWWPHSHLCFYSAILVEPSAVMDHCDRSVELAPADEYMATYRRGIARMRIEDLEGALADLETAIERWPADVNQASLEDAAAYVEALAQGENPFDAEAIERERSRY